MHQVRDGVSKLELELVDEAADEPVAVHRVVHDLLHRSTDGQEVLILVVLEENHHTHTHLRQWITHNPPHCKTCFYYSVFLSCYQSKYQKILKSECECV